jgi:hypothetical protein
MRPGASTVIIPSFGRTPLAEQINLRLKPDHIGGNFDWEREPNCACGRLKEAVADRFIFVSNFSDNSSNIFYMMPMSADGELFRSDGLPISCCPWCGDKIVGHKRYPNPEQR